MTKDNTTAPAWTDERERAIRERLAAATPGPWRYDERGGIDQLTDGGGKGYPLDVYPDSVEVVVGYDCDRVGVNLAADGELIAHAPEDLTAALAEIERLATCLRGEMAALEQMTARAERFERRIAELESDLEDARGGSR